MLTDLQPARTPGNSGVLRLVEADPAGPAKVRSQDFAGIRASIIRAERDAVIVAQADPADYSYLVIGGCVRTVRLMSDGRRQIGEFLFAGDFFGLEALNEHTFGLEAVCPPGSPRDAKMPRSLILPRTSQPSCHQRIPDENHTARVVMQLA